MRERNWLCSLRAQLFEMAGPPWWSMPFLFVGIIGLGFLLTFYDVFDINVSFIQSCVALKPGCTPANAETALRVPVVLNLAGYVIGALALAPLSDRFGRRNMCSSRCS